MKIIHCADIHADSKMGAHFSPEQAETRRKEVVDSFENMVIYAKKNDVKVILIAGDLFDTKTTNQKRIKQRVGDIMRRYPEIDFLYLRGNHDEDYSFTDIELPQNLKFFSKDGWGKFSYDGVDIYGREFANTIPDSVYSELVTRPDHVNVVALHGQVAGYTTKKDAPDISLPRLQNKNIDYLALGHIHEYRLDKLDSRGVWAYSGCLEGRGFDEVGEKGFVVLTVEDGKITTEFIPHAKRTIHDVAVELSGSPNHNAILDQIRAALKDIRQDDIVQVILEGEVGEDAEIDEISLHSSLASQHFLIRIKNKTTPFIDFKKYENDVSLKGEFIRLVYGQKDLSDEEKTAIIMTGIKALAGGKN